MAGGGHGLKFADLSLHAPKRWQVLTGQGMCAVMWLWVLYRAKEDGPVLLGWRHPWEGHGHGHGHGHAAHGTEHGHEEERAKGRKILSAKHKSRKNLDQQGNTKTLWSTKVQENAESFRGLDQEKVEKEADQENLTSQEKNEALAESDNQKSKKKLDDNQKPGQEAKTSDTVKRKQKMLEQHPKVISLIEEDN